MEKVDRLLGVLRRRGVASGADLQRDMGVSQPVLSRLVRAAGSRVCRLGRSVATRYALPREVAGLGSRLPVHRIDEHGRAVRLGVLHLLADGRHWLERESGPGQSFDGLPPFADEAKPQGYLGRAFPAAYPELSLPNSIRDWGDDHHLVALTRRGEDCVGNLVFGEESLDRWLAQPVPVRPRADYPALASGALTGQPGSSAGGEHPKFAVRSPRGHLLVKFAAGDGAAAERWRDLLVCEHLALETLREADVPAAASAWFDADGYRFLEVERFDRVGERGRRGVISLLTVTCHYLGHTPDSWSKAAGHLLDEPSVSIERADADRLVWLDTFGDLVANTDRHFGNVCFFAEEGARPALALTPAYDVLPMAFAPKGASVTEVTFSPRPPTAANLHLWDGAAGAALRYWDRIRREGALTAGFRAVASACQDAVARLAAARP